MGGVSRTIYAHYAQAGWHDFDPTSPIPHTAILEIETEEPKPIQVAQIYDPEQNPINGRVYSEDGIAPTLRTPTGGLSEPKIMQIGSYSPSSACNAKVLDTDGICPTLLDHKGAEPAIVEPLSCAMRGRNPNNPSDRTAGINTEQRLEIGSDVANCVTTVQKDSMLPEPIKIRQATAQGYIECPPGGGFDAAYPNSKLRRGRVQDNGDVVGAITASGDEHCVYEGVSILGYTRDDKGNVQNYHEREVAGTIHTSSGSGGNTDQFVKEAISRKDDVVFKEMPDGNIHAYRANDPKKSTAPEWQITNADNVHPTITTSHEPKVLLKYRIRKLTERERFRLMGVDDADIDKLKSAKLMQTLKSGIVKEKPMPKTQLYKMAGNSIVVNVLYHIFHQMFIAEPPRPKPIQKSLFDI